LRSTAAGTRMRPPAQIPLSGSAQPPGEEQHHPALPGGGRPAPGHDGARLLRSPPPS
jgi:hypothetical protein